jgi:hypothetical protein
VATVVTAAIAIVTVTAATEGAMDVTVTVVTDVMAAMETTITVGETHMADHQRPPEVPLGTKRHPHHLWRLHIPVHTPATEPMEHLRGWVSLLLDCPLLLLELLPPAFLVDSTR